MRSQDLYPPPVQSASHPGIQTRDTREMCVREVRGVIPAKDMKNDNNEQHRQPDSLIYKRFM